MEFDRERKLRLDVVGHAVCAGADGLRRRDQRPRVAEQRPPRVGQPRGLGRTVEQREPQRRLQRLNRLTDRRLHPAEFPCRSGKAPASATATRTRIWSRVSGSIIWPCSVMYQRCRYHDYHNFADCHDA